VVEHYRFFPHTSSRLVQGPLCTFRWRTKMASVVRVLTSAPSPQSDGEGWEWRELVCCVRQAPVLYSTEPWDLPLPCRTAFKSLTRKLYASWPSIVLNGEPLGHINCRSSYKQNINFNLRQIN
jgi:hypothetical protein